MDRKDSNNPVNIGEIILDPFIDDNNSDLSMSTADLIDNKDEGKDELIEFLNEKIFSLEKDRKMIEEKVEKLERSFCSIENNRWWDSVEIFFDRSLIVVLSGYILSLHFGG